MKQRIRELRARRATLSEQANGILTAAGERSLNAEEAGQFDQLHRDIAELGQQVERLERQEAVTAELAVSQAESREAARGTETDRVLSGDPAEAGEQERSAFGSYIVHGAGGMSEEERTVLARYADRPHREGRAQSVGVAADGGYTVPVTLLAEFEQALATYGGMFQVSTIRPTSAGEEIKFPTANNTAQAGQIVAENDQVTEQKLTFGTLSIKAYKYTSNLILIPTELLEDSIIDIANYAVQQAGERISRAANPHFTTGTGAGQPRGIITAATLGKTAAAGQVADVIWDDLIDLTHSVDAAYRPGARFMMTDTTVAKLKKKLDTTGRPLWSAGIAAGQPDRLADYPYQVNNDMAALTAGAKSILFGALSKYLIRQVRGVRIRRLVERYADFDQIGILAFFRMDGNLLDAGTHPVKYFQNAAS